ncbi:hypothetical protein RF11_03497 [Thelohanellus kitauei]|uniref:Uncharacterized protein n=1 Tax=Thelohanellus kitauei TaxID=669202 RepID=A0A0C2MM08_THEKT|nr:hypothetical protein RF11_03497 [Thelohanellus kitauei]
MFQRPSYLAIDYNLRSDVKNFKQFTDAEIENIMRKIIYSSSRPRRYRSFQYENGRFSLKSVIEDVVYLFVPVDTGNTTNKLSKLWRGSYEVVEVKMPLVKIKTETGKKWIHANRCKKAQANGCYNVKEGSSHQSWESDDEEEQDENGETVEIEEEVNIPDNQSTYNLRTRENILKPEKYCQEGEKSSLGGGGL